MRIRVVFQGGGARLVTLLAAAKALEDMKQTYKMEIVDVGGVSAGSIAAAALAHSDSVGVIASRLRDEGLQLLKTKRKDLKRLSNTKSMLSQDGLKLASMAFSGKPLIAPDGIGEALGKAFRSSEKIFLYGGLLLPTTVFRTNLLTGESEACNSQTKQWEKAEIGKVLYQSCMLPLILSTFENGSFTDGGVASNLPATYFISDTEPDIVTLAICFPQEKRSESSNLLSYASSLLFSAMDASVEDSKSQIKRAGGAICEVESPYGTMDFESAFEDGLNQENFDGAARDIIPLIVAALEPFSKPDIRPTSPTILYEDKFYRLHNALFESFPVIRNSVTQIQISGDTINEAWSKGVQKNRLQYLANFSPATDRGIRVLNLGLPNGEFSPPAISLSICDDKGNDLQCEYQLYAIKTENGILNRAHIYLLSDFSDQTGSITLSVDFEHETAVKILKQSDGYNLTECPSDVEFGSMTWALVVPKAEKLDIQDLRAEALGGNVSEQVEREISDIDFNTVLWSSGKILTHTECNNIIKLLKSDLKDFQVYGWRVDHLESGGAGGFHLKRSV